MKRLILLSATTMLLSGGALGEELDLACAKTGDLRTIKVIAPGEKGESCDVRYSRNNGDSVTVPYFADNSPPSYCIENARALAANLTESGFVCSPAAERTAASPSQATDPAEDNIVQLVITAGQTEPVEIVIGNGGADAGPDETAPEPEPVADAAPNDDAGADSGADPATEIAEPSNETAMNKILTAPPVSETAQLDLAITESKAVRGPAQLTTDAGIAPRRSPAASSVGRLVGAAPGPASYITASSTGSQGVTPVTPASAPATLRDPEERIRATLHAQVAAWNEGNLDAFMATYWKNDDLKFVSGVDIAKGWSATQKSYREQFADSRGLGHLALDKLDTVMVTDDVGIVTGRFNLVKDDETASGVFSLVMRQTGGVWRIVHDHSVYDPVSE